MSDLTVTIYFDWAQASADPRQYNQQRTLLLPNVEIAVNIPLKAMYIHNAEAILQAQIASEGKIKPVLTPLGMVYADNVLRAAYEDMKVEAEETSDDEDIQWQPSFDEEKKIAYTVIEDDSEFPVEEAIDSDEDELDEILWEN